jgi:large subunit ribosomal protein L22
MSTTTKTNERPGVRARLSDARFSAYKAREVLDLIRGKSVGEARSILQFCERDAADPIMKLLDSAVANAGNNNDIPPEELFVGACYADEGPTLKRWRPRARGRATRIRKRTCHITVIVSRYSATEMDDLRSRAERRGRASSDAGADRARRVARSRAAEAGDADEAGEAEKAEAEKIAAATAEADTDDSVVEQAAEEFAGETADAAAEPDEAPAEEIVDTDEEAADEAAADQVIEGGNADGEAGAPPADDSEEAAADKAAAETVADADAGKEED